MRFTCALVALVGLCACLTAVQARLYGAGGGAGAAVAPEPAVVQVAQVAEAQAQALTDAAGAKASAAKISAANWEALNRYGNEIGVPLLVRNYGAATNLYAAALPPRSFVGRIDPAFVRDSYGNIKLITGSSIGVAAI